MAVEDKSAEPEPPAKAGWLRLVIKHKVATLCGSGAAFVLLAFTQNLINAEIACSINFAQPNLSDACGYLGLGDKPNRRERLAWAALSIQLKTPSEENCRLLASHARRFSSGAFAAEADRLAKNPIVTEIVTWTPEVRTLPVGDVIPETGLHSKREAQLEVRSRVVIKAKAQCAGYINNGPWRLASFKVTDERYSCDISGGVHYCSLEAQSQCSLEKRDVKQVSKCGIAD